MRQAVEALADGLGFAVAVFGEEAGGEVEVGDGGQFAVFLIVGRVGAAVVAQLFGALQQEGEIAPVWRGMLLAPLGCCRAVFAAASRRA